MPALLCHDQFAAVVRATPDTIAVADGGRTLTYADLDRRSARIAATLRGRGAGPERLVAILVERGADLPAAALGVWRSGAAYLALDPRTPRERLRTIAGSLHPTAVVTQGPLRSRAAALGVPVVVLDHVEQPDGAPGGGEAASAVPDQSADSLAYAIHTSGSSGRPKGVGVSHRALVAIVDSYRTVYGMGRDVTRVLQLASFGFDVGTADLARTLLTGATLIMCPAATLTEAVALADLVDTSATEYLEITPSLLRPLVRHLRAAGRRLDVRFVIVGGEVWTHREHAELREVLTPCARVFNTYGLTEATIDNTHHELPPAASTAPGSVPIGRAFPSSSVLLLDADLGAATAGEIYVGGPQLARGYLGDPRATADRFVPAPDGPPGSRLYRTGDLAHAVAEGGFRYDGRADDVRKIRGARVSLVEVQTVLTDHPSVSAAAVDVRSGDGPDGSDELVAHVVPALGADFDAAALRRHVAQRLPAAAVPGVVRPVPELPVTAGGKVDLAALARTLVTAGLSPTQGAAAAGAGTDPAAVVAAVLTEVLGVALGPDDDFLEAGGDSLRAAAVAAALRTRLGVTVDAASVLAAPTPAELIDALARPAGPADGPRPGVGAGTHGQGVLTPGQERLWHLAEADRLGAYNVGTVIETDGDLDLAALDMAWQLVVERHAALRSTFARTAHGARQYVRGARGRLDVVTLGAGDGATADAAADAWAARDLAAPFRLDQPLLVRATVLCLGPLRHRFVLTAHHLVCDGESVRIVLADLGTAYRAQHAGTPARLPALPTTYLDYAEWHRDRLDAGHHSAALDNAVRQLADAAAAPALPGPPAGDASGPARHRVGMEPVLCHDLRAVAAEQRGTVHTAVLAAVAALLHRWSGQREVVLGVPHGDRRVPNTDQLVGFLVDTVPVRSPVEASWTFADLVRRTRIASARAARGRDVPYDVLHDRLRREGTVLELAAWVNHLGPRETPPDLGETRTRTLPTPPAGALFDLNVYTTEVDDAMEIEVVVDPQRVHRGVAERFVEQLVRVLEQVSADPNTTVAALDLRDRTVGEDDAATDVDDSGALDVPAALERWVAHAPGAPAVRGAGAQLDRATLRTRASAVASALRATGCRPGDLVALHLERGPELVAGLLGAWTAGGRVCVIDPAHPAAWSASLLAGVRPGFLLARAAPPAELVAQCARTVCIDTATTPQPEPFRAGGGHLVFTSGTTGVPKAVRSDGTPLARFLARYVATFRPGPEDRVALLAGLGHDPLFRDVLVPLVSGATSCLPDEGVIRSGRELRAWLAAEGVTIAHLTPAVARSVAAAPGPALTELRLVVCAGDHLFAGDVAALRTAAPGVTVANGYGLTETPQVPTWLVLAAGDPLPESHRRVPIGDGGGTFEIHDPLGRPAAVGETGRLVAHGEAVARSVAAAAGVTGVLDTGDLARRLPDGTIEVLGRGDHLLSVAGHRVDPQTVDAALRRLPALRDACTAAHPDRPDQLVAYICPAPDVSRPVSPYAVRAELRAHLPHHLVPAEVMTLDRLPRTPNGKLDRAALPPWRADAAPAPGFAAADSGLERAVADVWREVLGGTAPFVDANFFDLGGSSLLMARVQSELEGRLGRPVSMVTLFEYPTIRSLAAHLGRPADDHAGHSRRRTPVLADAGRRKHIRTLLQSEDLS